MYKRKSRGRGPRGRYHKKGKRRGKSTRKVVMSRGGVQIT